MKIIISSYPSPVGDLIIGSYGESLCLCDWKYRKGRATIDSRIQKGLHSSYISGTSSIIENTKKQLNEYFKKERKTFEIPLLFVGTDFQKQVWENLLNIPFGKTMSYLNLAKSMNNTKAIRAIATANGANSISIFVPCHRIIGTDGKLVGYAGGIETKRKLLKLENETSTLFEP